MTPSQLLLPQAEIDSIESRLTNSGSTASVETVLAESEARVNSYLVGHTVDTAHKTSLIRSLALNGIYLLLGPVPKNFAEAAAAALKELEGIRDGAFKRITQTSTPAATGTSGGSSNIFS